MSYSIEQMARVAHAVIRELQIVNGEKPSPLWDDGPGGMREATRTSICGALAGEEPSDQWARWSKEMRADGWVRGDVKNPHANPPTHPCLVGDWDDLPFSQKVKDSAFRAVTDLMGGA